MMNDGKNLVFVQNFPYYQIYQDIIDILESANSMSEIITGIRLNEEKKMINPPSTIVSVERKNE